MTDKLLVTLRSAGPRRWLAPAGLALCLGWAYWPTACDLADRWAGDPQYSHGYFVPGFALLLLWLRRGTFPAGPLRACWPGLGLVALGAGLHLAGGCWYFDFLDALSLLPVLAGLAVCLGGLALLRWAWPAVGFLAFMVPLPYRLEVALGYPLQHFVTAAGTYLLQTCGLFASAEGNVIVLAEGRLGVVEACSGLGMLVTFFALSTGVALVLPRRWPDKVVLVLSAVPIAVAANVARVTATGVLHETAGSQAARAVFHDLAGWLMMPLALGLLWLEIKFLSRLLRDPAPGRPAVLHWGGAVLPAPARRTQRRQKKGPERKTRTRA